MNTSTTTPNDIDAFADLLRSALPKNITQSDAWMAFTAECGDVRQEDR